MHWKFNDGGRKQAGYKGQTGDCVTRAIAIATGKPYKEIYSELKKRLGKGKSPRDGIPKKMTRDYLADLGWTWVPVMKIGSGCRMHLKKDELPSGTIICKTSRHVVTAIDGVVQDTYDCTRDGTRCVYGYWKK